MGRYLVERAGERRSEPAGARVLFIGHEASRTGAPAILLNIIRHFSAELGKECITILDRGGSLEPEFERFSHVFMPATTRDDFYGGRAGQEEFTAEVAYVLDRFADDPPQIVFANSLETALYGATLKSLGLKVVTLVHEVADNYHPSALQSLDEGSDVIICPAEFVAERLRAAVPGCGERIVVEPQGLLRPNFGEVAWGTRERVFEEQGIAADDVVVLGCGTADGRKGIDIFTEVAGEVARAAGDSPPIWFVWLGGGFEHFHEHGEWRSDEFDRIKYWAEWDMRRSGAPDRICVVPPVADTEAYYAAADIFALTSRADPFPCVVHEAMACGMAVIAFEDAGGAPEAIGDAGFVVPYVDRAAMAEKIVELARDGDARRDVGDRARSRIKERYRFADYGDRLGEIAERLLAENASTGASKSKGRARAAKRTAGKRSNGGGAAAGRSTARRDVVFTAPAWSVSGVNTFTRHLMEHLQEHGHTPELVFANGRFYGLGADQPPPVPYRFLQPRANTARARWDALGTYFRENAPCVFVPNFDYLASALSPGLPSGVGVLGIAHSDHVEHYEHVYRLGRYWNKIVAVSSQIRDQIVELNPSFEPKLSEIPYGVPIPGEAELAAAIEARSASLEPIRILYAGRLEQEQKRILDYVDVVGRLAREGVPFELTIAGEGTMEARLARELYGYERAGSVKLTGRIEEEEVAALMRQSHVFLLLSDYEGLPVAVIEAMANGCVPVVPQIASGVGQLIASGENGYTYQPHAYDELVGLLARLQSDGGEPWRSTAVAAAATPAAKGLTVDAMGGRYAELIDEILEDLTTRRYRRPAPLTTIDPDAIVPASMASSFSLR